MVIILGGAVINGDIARARTIVNIEIRDVVTLMATLAALVVLGQPKIKVRITVDCTGSSYCPSFRQPGFFCLLVNWTKWMY